MVLISIILPTYNSEDDLITALDSIVIQTNKNFEVLVMDGASDDNTLEILKSYIGKIPNLKVYSQKDKGVYDAMNKGINLAKGQWLYFMGSDDTLYEPTTLEKVIKLLSKTTSNVVYGNVKIIGNTGWATNNQIYDGEFSLFKLLNTNICHQAIFYNKQFVKKQIGYFNLNYKICSDWDFNLRCRSKDTFEYTDLIIANFKSGGLSSNTHDKNFEADFIPNILTYFNWNLFNKMLNSKHFLYYEKVQQLAKSKYPLRYFLNRIIKNFKKKK